MASLALIWDLIAKDSASPVFNRVAVAADRAAVATDRATKSTDKAAASGSAFGKKAAAALGAVISIDIAAHMIKSAAQFQRSMLLIQTQAGASASEVKKMSSAILGMAGSVGTSPEKLAESLYHIESVGLRGATALGVLKVAAEGAKVGNADLEQTTNALTSAVASGIPGVKNMTQAMGALNAIVGSGDMNLEQLNEALGTGILTKAKTFGLSLRDVGAALATLGDLNIRGADAATQLRMSFEAMAKQGKPGQAALEGIGIKVNQLRDDMQKGGLNKALLDLDSHLRAAGITGTKVGGFLLDAFSKKGGSGVTLLLSNLARFETKMDEVGKGASRFGSEWQATTKTVSFAFDRVKATVEAIGIQMGTAMLPVAGHIADAFVGLLGFLKPVGEYVGGALANAWHMLSGAVSAVGVVLGPVVSFFDGLKGPIGAVTVALLALWGGFKLGAAVPGVVSAIGSAFETVALKAMYAADGAKVAAGVITGSAATASAGVAEAGAVASIGWKSIAGPIGAAAIGIFALVSMFHKSSTASKEATDAAKAYTDALSSGGADNGATILDAIQKQLTDNKLPETLQTLNAALGKTAQFAGGQFIDAISRGGKPLEQLRTRLEDVIKAGTRYEPELRGQATVYKAHFTPAATAAADALKHLNTQYDGLTKAGRKDLLNTKTFAGAAASIDKVSASTQVGSDMAKQYANMLGIAVDKNGIAAVSAKTLATAVNTVKRAYDTATGAGAAFLAALDTFSKSAGSAADRAALIGSTLKAANGDLLNYEGAVAGAVDANKGLIDTLKSAAQQAFPKMKAPLDRFVSSLIDMRTGAINFRRQGAGQLIQGLQGIQTAAMNAAQATYQHFRATMSGKQAADAAYRVYKNQTQGALIDEASKLGLTEGQAKKLADRYFGMPKKVKTLIEAEGTNPIVDVLNKIGTQLSYMTGHPWNPKVNVTDNGTAQAVQDRINNIHGGSVDVAVNYVPGQRPGGRGVTGAVAQAAGTLSAFGTRTIPPNTVFTVGEGASHTWEGGITDSQGRASIFSNAQSKRMGFPEPKAYANGTGGIVHQGHDWVFDGIRYASQRAAENARTRYQRSHGASQTLSTALGTANTALGGINGQGGSPQINASGFSNAVFMRQIRAAAEDIAKARAAGASKAQVERMINRLHSLEKAGLKVAESMKLPGLVNAQARLAAAKAVMASDRASFRSTIAGSFDVSSAGADPVTGKITGAGILAQAKQAAQRAKVWVQGIRKLAGLKVFPSSYMRALMGKGPDGLPEVQALLSLNPSQMKQLAAANAELNQYAGQGADIGAKRLDQAAVNRAQKSVNTWQLRELRREKHVEKQFDRLFDHLDHHLHLTATVNGRELVKVHGREVKRANR